MNEIEHFFDIEIRRATDRIKHGWLENFNGVEADAEIVKKLNIAHIEFCQKTKKYFALTNYTDDKERKIAEMQHYIDCLKAELAEIQQNKPELPAEPIKIADWLVDKHMEYAGEFERNFAAENAGKIVASSPIENYRKSQVAKVRQIAEHLLVYCNHAEVE